MGEDELRQGVGIHVGEMRVEEEILDTNKRGRWLLRDTCAGEGRVVGCIDCTLQSTTHIIAIIIVAFIFLVQVSPSFL